MPRGKPKTKVTPGDESEAPTLMFYRHKYANCYLTLNPEETAAGKVSIRIHLVKNKDAAWGVFETDDPEVQAWIAKHPWFGKSILEIDADEAAKLKQTGRELYHRGVASAMSRKPRK